MTTQTLPNPVDEFAAAIRATPVTGGPDVDLSAPLAQHLHKAGYRKLRSIATFEELEAMADGTAVLDYEHDVSTKHDGKWHGYEMNPLDSRKFKNYGPFTVLWEPEVSE